MAPQYYYCPHCRHVISQWDIYPQWLDDKCICGICGGLVDTEADAMGHVVQGTAKGEQDAYAKNYES